VTAIRNLIGLALRSAAAIALTMYWPSAAANELDITPAPAFDASALTEPPRAAWITNGGTLSNQRYSPLDLINRDNVAGLRARWRTSLGSGDGQGNSGQAQILVYEGVLFVSNGENDVFAMDVDTGRILWTYHGNPAPRAGSPFGRSNRGVAMGDGKIFASLLDARVAALDQRSGEVVWIAEVAPWEQGYSITSAPLYYDGMVITGVSGGVMGTRGRVTAFDATDGSVRWVFYTIPGPGEFGHDTWPADSDAWQRGGAPVWHTPAVDPELGMIYFSTGNPGPVLYGGDRPGDNLFNNSIVALDVATGAYRWHFQQVRHDIWDYDSPNPVVLFDAEIDGRMRQGLVQVGKTGWAYILDRETGEPLIGIEDRPVPQEPRQATASTQPYPIGDSIVPQYIDIPPERASGDAEIVNEGRIFTPFWTERRMMKPAAIGGANWPPSAYDSQTHLLYVCATDRIGTYAVDLPLQPWAPNQPYFGGSLGQTDAPDRGILAALDLRTNRLVWRQQWRDICYSGVVATEGGLLFVGRSDGRLTALDKRDGARLWAFQTDAGVNTTVTTFEHRGEQLVVVHAGGGVFANGRRGDGVWMFSLDGTIDPLSPGALLTDAAVGTAVEPLTFTRPADHDTGAFIYREACLPCHGSTGRGGEGGGGSLLGGTLDDILAVTAAGRNNMPAFRHVFSADELRDVATYIVEVLAARE
jgi:quinohemoprotein ethanol dehydrogenase